MISQTNPKANYLAHKDAIDQALHRALDSGWYILGAEVKAFEAEFAQWLGAKHAIGVANGTDAIEVALHSVGVQCGDVVFTVGHTAVATVVGVVRAGAKPVLVDIDPQRYTMCPKSLERAIEAVKKDPAKFGGRKPRAVVCVHLYGQPADLDAILAICKQHDLLLIEDCAQCHGATWNGRTTGTIGHAASFSFYPTKNLGAIGDGGATVTNDPDADARARRYREYGWQQRYVSAEFGCNTRLDELQAAILRAKLPKLTQDNARRQAIAERYRAAFPASICPPLSAGVTHVYHQFVLNLDHRDRVQADLKAAEIGTLVHYPMPVHLQPAYASLPRAVDFPNTERAAQRVLSLPMYPELTDGQVQQVIDAVKRVLKV